MKQKTKDRIVDVGSVVLTVGTACMVETLAGYGTVALLNHVLKDTWTKGQIKFFQGIVCTGCMGVAALTAYKTHDEFMGIMQDLIDLFPTTKEEKESNG